MASFGDTYHLEERLSVRLPDGMKAALEERARLDMRSVSNFVVAILARELRGDGRAPVPSTVPQVPAPAPARQEIEPAEASSSDTKDAFPDFVVPDGWPRPSAPSSPAKTSVEVDEDWGSDLPPTLMLAMMVAEGEDQNSMFQFVLENFDCDTCPNCGWQSEADDFGARFFSIVNPDGRVRCVACRKFFHPGHDF
jgi:hypothetical protein